MCGGPKWKREEVKDHKFDFIHTQDFIDNRAFTRLKYLWLYLIIFKDFLVYVSDIFSAITRLTTTSWSDDTIEKCDDCISISANTTKWLFVGCVIFGFLLLGYESRKAKRIIASRDISYAFTNVMANNYYSLRSYAHFCFFDHISNSTKTSDDFAFFIFFTFKSWKRLLLADGPRQAINALTLYAVYKVNSEKPGEWYHPSKYFVETTPSTAALIVTTFFTVVVFTGSLLLLLAAGICYIPLLCHIRGNLKEYCCHIVDKRIEEVITRERENRLQEAVKLEQKEARGDYSHLKSKKGAKPLPQPTLPTLSVDDDLDDKTSMNTRGPAPSTYTQDYYYYQDTAADYPPPMPAYNPNSAHQQTDSGTYFNASQTTLTYEDPAYQRHQMYDDDNDTAQLTAAAAPFAQQAPVDRPGSAQTYGYLGAAQPRMASPYSPQTQMHPSGNGMSYADYPQSYQQNPYGGYPGADASQTQRW